MNCQIVAEETDRWLAGGLSREEAQAFERHLSTCLACEARVARLSTIDTLPRDIAPPPALRGNILQAVAHARHSARWREKALATAAVAAVAFVAIVLAPPRKSASDFPGAGKALLASRLASPQILQLDRAAAEISGALKVTPTDSLLASDLRRIQRQREALRTLVEKAPE